MTGRAFLSLTEKAREFGLGIGVDVALLALLVAVLTLERPSGQTVVKVATPPKGFPVDQRSAAPTGPGWHLDMFRMTGPTVLISNLFGRMEPFSGLNAAAQRLVGMTGKALLVGHSEPGRVTLIAVHRETIQVGVPPRHRARGLSPSGR